MTRGTWIVGAAALAFAAGCNKAPAPLNDADRAAIADSVSQVATQWMASFSARPTAENYLSAYVRGNDLVHAEYGMIYPTYDSLVAGVRAFLKPVASFKVTMGEKRLTVLDRDVVVLSAHAERNDEGLRRQGDADAGGVDGGLPSDGRRLEDRGGPRVHARRRRRRLPRSPSAGRASSPTWQSPQTTKAGDAQPRPSCFVPPSARRTSCRRTPPWRSRPRATSGAAGSRGSRPGSPAPRSARRPRRAAAPGPPSGGSARSGRRPPGSGCTGDFQVRTYATGDERHATARAESRSPFS